MLRSTLWIALIVAVLPSWAQQSAPPLKLVQTIALPGVEGRIDHMAVDVKGGRLFIAALGNNTVEVVDLKKGKRVASLQDFHEPQGIAYLPEYDRIVVASGQGARVDILSGKTYRGFNRIDQMEDADNVRYDPVAKRVWVGYGSGALAEIDATTGKKIADVKLSGHPEAFQLERTGPRIFVNVPTARQIEVVDRKTMRVTARWPVSAAGNNFPMALNEASHLLVVGCRQPPSVLVFDTSTGRLVLKLECVADTDDLFLERNGRRLYVSGGSGRIDWFNLAGDDRAPHMGRLLMEKALEVTTAPGARTSLFVPELRRIYLAVPHRGAQTAEIRVYETLP